MVLRPDVSNHFYEDTLVSFGGGWVLPPQRTQSHGFVSCRGGGVPPPEDTSRPIGGIYVCLTFAFIPALHASAILNECWRSA